MIRYFTTAMLVNGKEWSLFKHMDDVIMIGYPKGIYDEKNNQPIFLKGSLTANPSLDCFGKHMFLIDVAVYIGLSVVPVLSVQERPIIDRRTGSITVQWEGRLDVIYRDLFQKYGSCHSWFD